MYVWLLIVTVAMSSQAPLPKSTVRTGLLSGVRVNVPCTKWRRQPRAMLRMSGLVMFTEKLCPLAPVPVAEPVIEYTSSLQISVLSPCVHSRWRVEFQVIVPPLTSQYLNLTKNSSLAVAIGYPDLVSVSNTSANQTGQVVEAVAMMMLVYLIISLSISGFMNWYNRRVALVTR